MFRSNYSNSVSCISPEGRIFQIEYAERASSHGCRIHFSFNENSGGVLLRQKKNETSDMVNNRIMVINDDILITFTGVLIDGITLLKYLENEATEFEILNRRSFPLKKLTNLCASLMGKNIMHLGGRPFGVQPLICGSQGSNLKIFKICNHGKVIIPNSFPIFNEKELMSIKFNETLKNHDIGTLDSTIMELLTNRKKKNDYNLILDNSHEQICVFGKKLRVTVFNEYVDIFYCSLVEKKFKKRNFLK